MLGSKEEPYPGLVLISFWCYYDNKNLYFFTFYDFSSYFSFAHFGYYQNLVK